MGERPRPNTKVDRPIVTIKVEEPNSLVIWSYVVVYNEDVMVLGMGF